MEKKIQLFINVGKRPWKSRSIFQNIGQHVGNPEVPSRYVLKRVISFIERTMSSVERTFLHTQTDTQTTQPLAERTKKSFSSSERACQTNCFGFYSDWDGWFWFLPSFTDSNKSRKFRGGFGVTGRSRYIRRSLPLIQYKKDCKVHNRCKVVIPVRKQSPSPFVGIIK